MLTLIYSTDQAFFGRFGTVDPPSFGDSNGILIRAPASSCYLYLPEVITQIGGMQEISIQDKQKYLELKYPFSSIPLLSERRYCMQCKKDFLVERFKVFKTVEGREVIACPNAPACKGTVIDWYKLH